MKGSTIAILGGAAAALLLLRKGSNGNGVGNDPGPEGSGAPGGGDHITKICRLTNMSDKQRAKLRKAIADEVARVGTDFSGLGELNEKAFEVVRAVTMRFCANWPVPDALHELDGYLDTQGPAYRQWWEHLDIGVRRAMGAWVT